MLAEEGDDLSSIEVPSDLGPEGSGSTTVAEENSAESETKSEAKEEKAKAIEHDTAGDGQKLIKHPKPLFPSVSRL